MDCGQVGITGVAVAHQYPGELSQHPAGVDGGHPNFKAAVTDVQQRQVLGAGNVHIVGWNRSSRSSMMSGRVW